MQNPVQAALEAERLRIERARKKNEEFLRRMEMGSGSTHEESLAGNAKRRQADIGKEVGGEVVGDAAKRQRQDPGQINTSVYVEGLSSALARKQLESYVSRIGKVKRIKFYKDDQGQFKGDAVVTFTSAASMLQALKQLTDYELVPGVKIRASVAEFKTPAANPKEKGHIQIDSNPKSSSYGPRRANETPEEARLRTTQMLYSRSPEKTETAPERTESEADETKAMEKKDVEEEKKKDFDGRMSKTVVLHNVFTPKEAAGDPKFLTDLEEDMKEECQRLGTVLGVECFLDGRVAIQFDSLVASARCLQVMNKRFFGGRQLLAEYDQTQLEEPEDDDAKLENFFALVS